VAPTGASFLGFDLGELGSMMSGPLVGAASAFGMTTLVIGFILYYVLPFMPFMYFFFAASGWAKAIFEAMVGLPLWALAHLRIDGEGIPGDAGAAGWMLIFEILLRPLLIVIAFVGSIVIFSALVRVLNEIFDLVVANVGGFDLKDATKGKAGAFGWEDYRNPIDQFFYTVIYTIIVYMMALSSFKLIDAFPNQIMRWMGDATQKFGEFMGDPAGELVEKIGSGVKLSVIAGGGLLAKMGGNSGRNPINDDD
jgi:conjugal transfer/type IV secretion protein DotA/TraY